MSLDIFDDDNTKIISDVQRLKPPKGTKNTKKEIDKFIKETKDRLKSLSHNISIFFKHSTNENITVVFNEKIFDNDLENSKKLSNTIQDMMDGVSFAIPDKVQLYTIHKLILVYLKHKDDKDTKFLIQGLQQIGKTLTLIFTALLLSNIKKLKQESVLPLIFVPSSNNNKNDFVNELKVMLSILKYIIVKKNNNTSVSLSCLKDCLEDNNLQLDDIVIMRNRGVEKEVKKLMEKISNASILPITDECDYGCGKGQIMSKLHEEHAEIWLPEILNSATPDEARSAKNIIPFPMLVPNTYYGLPEYMGKLPSAHSVYEDMQDGMKFIKIEQIDHLFPKLLPYLDRKNREKNIDGFVKELCEVVKKIGDHIFIRPFAGKSKNQCQEIAQKLRKKVNGEWTVVQYAGEVKNRDVIYLPNDKSEKFEDKSLKEVLVDLKRRDNKIIIISSSARSKRGDSYPYWIRHFFDFSDSSKYMNTELQATLGRACGHNKDSICYFKEFVVKVINDFRNGNSNKNYSSRTSKYKIRNKTQTQLLSFSEGENS